MRQQTTKAGNESRKPRQTAAKPNPKFRPRSFDPVAYAAALEVLG